MLRYLPYLGFCILFYFSFSSNPPQRRTGAPGEMTCAGGSCHGAFSTSIMGSLELDGIPSLIEPNSQYALTMRLNVIEGTPARGGFQMTVLDETGNPAGNFSNPSGGATVSSSNGRQYFEHNPSQSFDGGEFLEYKVDWTSPETPGDSVIFYAASIFANGNGNNSGDRLVTHGRSWSYVQLLQIAGTVMSVSCIDSDDGSISLDISGGIAPYSIVWTTGDTTTIIENLAPGNYAVTVTDMESTSAEASFDVEDEPDDSTPPMLICVEDTLTINSCAPFVYPLPIANDNCSDVNLILVDGLGPNRIFGPGLHNEIYEARDRNGNASNCTIVIKNTVTFDFEIEINNLNCHDDEFGSVNIPTDQYEWVVLQDDVGLPPGMMPPGKYVVIISDITGCSDVVEIEITRPDSLYFSEITVENASTENGDGSVDVTISGGTPPYTYQWYTEDEKFASSEDLKNLFAGTYLLEVTDKNGCIIQTDSLLVDQMTAIATVGLSSDLKIYPNPIQDLVQIHNSESQKIISTTVYDNNGKMILRSFGQSVSTGNLHPGIYSFVIQLENGSRYVTVAVKAE